MDAPERLGTDLRTIPYSLTIKHRDYKGEFPICSTVTHVVNSQAEHGLPFALCVVPKLGTHGELTGGLVMQDIHHFSDQNNPDNADIILLVEKTNKFSFINLVKKRETADCLRQFVQGNKHSTEETRVEIAEAQYLTALRFSTGCDFETSEASTAQFALLSASNGHRLGFQLFQRCAPSPQLPENLLTLVPANSKYLEAQKVKNVLLAFRELLADMHQVTVTDVKVFASKHSQTEKEGNIWVVRRTFKISLIGTSANGRFEIVREHDAILRPFNPKSKLDTDAQEIATRIGGFLSKIWGYEVQGALNPNHPHHKVLSQHLDHLTVNPEAFEKTYHYKNLIAHQGFISDSCAPKNSFLGGLGVTDDTLGYTDLIGSSSTKVKYTRGNSQFEISVPKKVETY